MNIFSFWTVGAKHRSCQHQLGKRVINWLKKLQQEELEIDAVVFSSEHKTSETVQTSNFFCNSRKGSLCGDSIRTFVSLGKLNCRFFSHLCISTSSGMPKYIRKREEARNQDGKSQLKRKKHQQEKESGALYPVVQSMQVHPTATTLKSIVRL